MDDSTRNPPPEPPADAAARFALNAELDVFEPPEFEPAHPRPRLDGWTPNRQVAFIRALAESGCVADACRAVGMSERSAYALRARTDAISFRNAWEVALDYSVRRLGDAALSRAINGVAVPVFYRGEQVGERRHYDERLAMFLLRYRDPARYGRSNDRREFSGHPEALAVDLIEATAAVFEDAGLHAADVPMRFAQRVREFAAKVLHIEQGARGR